MRGAVTRSGAALKSVATFLAGPWGIALAVATLGVDLLGKYIESLDASSDELTNSLDTAISTVQPAAPYFSMPAQTAGCEGPQSVAFSFPSSGN